MELLIKRGNYFH